MLPSFFPRFANFKSHAFSHNTSSDHAMPFFEMRISARAFNRNTTVLSHLKPKYCNPSSLLAAAAAAFASKAKHFISRKDLLCHSV